jgi:hypothetical protein
LVYRTIKELDEPEWISNVDINHPSFKRLD